MIKIPQKEIWTQNNLGDKFGSLWSSNNLDLSSEQGKLQISPRLMLNASTTQDADLGLPFAFAYNPTLSKWHAGCGAVMFVGGTTPEDVFTQDAATTPPSFTTTSTPDLNVFTIGANTFTYGMSAELYKLAANGASWSVITSIGGSNNGAPLIPFKGRLYYRVGSTGMGSIDTGDTPVAPGNTYAISFNDLIQTIQCGRANSQNIYLGTRTNRGKNALVYEWDGVNTTPTTIYEIPAQGVLAMTIKYNVPWLIDSKGVLRVLNGGAFVEMARLPFDVSKLLPYANNTSEAQLVHYNGMVTDGESILINLNGKYSDTNATNSERVPSGVWEYNETNGLFHHESPSAWLSGTTTTPTDYGHTRISAAGAISKALHSTAADNGNLLVGLNYYSDATTVVSGIFLNDLKDTIQKAGGFTSPKIYSSNISEIWQKLYVRFRKFLTATDKVVVKYRTDESASSEATITWSNDGDVFTTAQTGLAVGDEVEIIQGIGAGICGHITVIEGAGTYTITIDETALGISAGVTAKARFQKWKKLGSYSAQTEDFYGMGISTGNSTWIQFKVWILSTGKNEINDIILVTKEGQKPI